MNSREQFRQQKLELKRALKATLPRLDTRWARIVPLDHPALRTIPPDGGCSTNVPVRTPNGIVEVHVVRNWEGFVYFVASYESLAIFSPSPRPPVNGEFLLNVFLNSDEREALIGDLEEMYERKRERLGKRRADIWYYSEVGRSLWPLLRRAVTKVGGLIAFGEWLRRHVF